MDKLRLMQANCAALRVPQGISESTSLKDYACINIDAEYQLIQQKKSKLSRRKRDAVVRAYEYKHKINLMRKESE